MKSVYCDLLSKMGGTIKTSEFLVQSVATLCISFLACQTGYVFAWPSYTVANFTSNSTVLSRPMTSLEISLLGGLPNVGGLLASPFCSVAFNKFGRKYATMFFGLPYVIAWTMISLTNDVTLVLIAMAIAGVGVAGQNVSLIYISEISNDAIRGGLTAFSASGYYLGILVSYIIGGQLTYLQGVYTHLTLSVICIALLMFLHESPVFLVMVGKEKEAAKSIAFYRRMKIGSKEIEAEISKIRLQTDPRLEKMIQGGVDLEEAKNLLKNKKETPNESAWKLFKKSESSKRALGTVLLIMTMTIMMGCVVLQVYAEPLFKEAVPSMPANQCAIFLAIDFLVASLICVLFIDKFGRKTLLTVTSAGSGVCTLLLGSQLQLHWAPHWFTALLIYVYSFIYSVGCAVIPFVLAAEVFLPEVRSFCNSITMAFVWIATFTTVFIFNPLVDALGLGPVFYFFSAVCFIGAFFSKFFVPETRGLPVDAIQLLFLKKK
ncbi:facilitated trehalose transporter Tret1 [Manduca sexta]|uniref:Major facilitator superfamily (MFS) profile domain-containing protein n=1 Tax=Manduca sexta TaxID=7130 RepID=A0A921Z1A8_MANSE|nr:facilitated trehalose transporter Tret1 [Manduca sexta]KAG6449638.1 hypothetical protein O3G_MSEX006157 [Manduca sexta]